MADGLTAILRGEEALYKKLEGLSVDLRTKGGRFALRKAAQVVARAAAENAQRLNDSSTPETISKNIVNGGKYPGLRWSSKLFKLRGDLGFRVGVVGGAAPAKASGEFKGAGKDNPGGDTWYWRLLEFGTSKTPARPFLRRALSENTEAATTEFIRQYDRSLERLLAKLGKGNPS